MRDVAAAIFVIIIITWLVYSFIKDNQLLERKKLINTDSLDKQATIVQAKPELIGTKNNKHFILKIVFSDGSTYQDKCNAQKNGLGYYEVSFDKEHAMKVMNEAIEAHRKACEEK